MILLIWVLIGVFAGLGTLVLMDNKDIARDEIFGAMFIAALIGPFMLIRFFVQLAESRKLK